MDSAVDSKDFSRQAEKAFLVFQIESARSLGIFNRV